MRVIICLVTLYCVIQKSDAQDSGVVISLWPNGAPGFEGRKDEPELAKDYWVKNVHNPSITALTVYLPSKEKATGAAVIICPGGDPLGIHDRLRSRYTLRFGRITKCVERGATFDLSALDIKCDRCFAITAVQNSKRPTSRKNRDEP